MWFMPSRQQQEPVPSEPKEQFTEKIEAPLTPDSIPQARKSGLDAQISGASTRAASSIRSSHKVAITSLEVTPIKSVQSTELENRWAMDKAAEELDKQAITKSTLAGGKKQRKRRASMGRTNQIKT